MHRPTSRPVPTASILSSWVIWRRSSGSTRRSRCRSTSWLRRLGATLRELEDVGMGARVSLVFG